MAEATLTAAELGSLSVEAFLNGVLFMLFCLSTHFMLKRHREKGRRSRRSLFRDPLFLGSALMSSMSIAHWSLAIYHSIMAFIEHELGIPEVYYFNMEKASFVSQTALLVGMLAMGNVLMLYRVWTIWEGSLYAMAIPVASFVSALTCALALIVSERRWRWYEPQTGDEVATWLQGAFISDIFANVISSGLIIWKLWYAAAAQVQRTPGTRRIYWLMSVFVESSALYVAWNILFTVVFDRGSPVWRAIADTWVPICGISFALINVRVGMGYLLQSGSTAATQRLPGAHRVAFGDATFAITVTREVETDCNDEEYVLSPWTNSVDDASQSKKD